MELTRCACLCARVDTHSVNLLCLMTSAVWSLGLWVFCFLHCARRSLGLYSSIKTLSVEVMEVLASRTRRKQHCRELQMRCLVRKVHTSGGKCAGGRAPWGAKAHALDFSWRPVAAQQEPFQSRGPTKSFQTEQSTASRLRKRFKPRRLNGLTCPLPMQIRTVVMRRQSPHPRMQGSGHWPRSCKTLSEHLYSNYTQDPETNPEA